MLLLRPNMKSEPIMTLFINYWARGWPFLQVFLLYLPYRSSIQITKHCPFGFIKPGVTIINIISWWTLNTFPGIANYLHHEKSVHMSPLLCPVAKMDRSMVLVTKETKYSFGQTPLLASFLCICLSLSGLIMIPLST